MVLRIPTLALGSVCALSTLSLLMNAIALCRLTCFLRRVNIASRHCSTMMTSSLGAPVRQRRRGCQSEGVCGVGGVR